MNDGLIGLRDTEWLQGDINIILGLFLRIGLMANVFKFKTKTCQPGEICLGMSEEAVGRKSTGKGATYREKLRRCMPYPDSGVDLAEGFMTSCHRRLHGTDPAIYWDWLPVSQKENLPHLFEVNFPRVMTTCQVPFLGCHGLSLTWSVLRNHFNRRHWRGSLLIL